MVLGLIKRYFDSQSAHHVKKIGQAFGDSLRTSERAPCHREKDSKRHNDPMVIMSVKDFLRTSYT
jgi:hypothetical protein